VASIGHIALGVAAARFRGQRSAWSMALWATLSLLPDADVLGFSLGVRYADAWGHRGATHSLLFALVVGALVGWAAPLFGARRLKSGLLATAVVASHPLLDTLTTGGLGCALFWPFDPTRYFAPWRPIPVAPIGLRFFSSRGLAVAAVEMVLFLPCWLYAFWPRRSSVA
jgi:inner membrane protein